MESFKEFAEILRCPKHHCRLQLDEDQLKSVEGGQTYPIADGIPILINEDNSIFSIEDFLSQRNTTFNLKPNSLGQIARRVAPSISLNLKSRENYRKLARDLPSNARVLVIGGSIEGFGMDEIFARSDLKFVNTDVSFGPLTQMIADGHDLPFADSVFDCVITQAVLEHVLDPVRCTAEIHRVLKNDGIVYSEIPFMQQVHMGRYDFTRFTHLGHKRLFRKFEEIESGAVSGPGMALAWSWVHFLKCFFHNKRIRTVATGLGYLSSFFFKYFDYYLISCKGVYDSASGYYFVGKKTKGYLLDDKELVASYRGAFG